MNECQNELFVFFDVQVEMIHLLIHKVSMCKEIGHAVRSDKKTSGAISEDGWLLCTLQ